LMLRSQSLPQLFISKKRIIITSSDFAEEPFTGT
jgi:hypothetical protein